MKIFYDCFGRVYLPARAGNCNDAECVSFAAFTFPSEGLQIAESPRKRGFSRQGRSEFRFARNRHGCSTHAGGLQLQQSWTCLLISSPGKAVTAAIPAAQLGRGKIFFRWKRYNICECEVLLKSHIFTRGVGSKRVSALRRMTPTYMQPKNHCIATVVACGQPCAPVAALELSSS